MNIRYGKAFHYPRQIIKRFFSFIYPLVIRIWPLPKVMSIEETIHEIFDKKMSIARFGDSEFLYIVDKLSLPYQVYDTELANKLKKILISNDKTILVGLPSGYHSLNNLVDESVTFWRSQISWIYPRLQNLLDLKKVYANASMTRIYIELKDKSQCNILFDSVMSIWEDRDILLIEGEKSRLGVGNDLFSNARSVSRILGPAHNAYARFNDLLEAAQLHSKDNLILIAMGPTAKPLAFELAGKGYQALDIGNIDVEYEWYKMGATKKVKIEGKYTSEASGGRIVSDTNDPIYYSQIIEKFL